MKIKTSIKTINVNAVYSDTIRQNGKSYPALRVVFDGGVTADELDTLRSGSIEILDDDGNVSGVHTGYTTLGEHSVVLGKVTTAEQERDVDTTGTVTSITPVGQDHMVRIAIPQQYMRYVIDKGSIAIDGVSLTVASITGPDELEFWITPHTWERTIMHCYTPGTIVDIEVDMIAKYVEKLKIRND